jgi:Fe-S cluster assembly scaffold protein SufB
MNRAEALAHLQESGFNAVMAYAQRLTTDVATGYKPALDRAFATYIRTNSLATTVTTTTVAAADEYGFSVLLQAVAYDTVMPFVVVTPDLSVDAPLTNTKFSQVYKMMAAERDRLWAEAAAYGYGDETNVGGFKARLDFNEPHTHSQGEF